VSPQHRRVARAVAVVVTAGVLASCTPGEGSVDEPASPSFDWPAADELPVDDPSDLLGDVVDHTVGMRAGDRSAGMRVVPVQTVEEDAGETVVTLSSDILFDPSDATLSPPAEEKIGELVADVPDGATVQVHGHTDTVASDASNQDLSEGRAEAVADAVRAAREDLTLDVEGFGESRPAEPETGDEEAVAEARAVNRRVEIRYEG
jgi:OmpA-OmpF porin, OOP family